MRRWMAWFGQPALIEELLFETQHGIVDQSLHARMGAEPTNGDGFGLGWYGDGTGPGLYHIEDAVQATFGVSDGESLWAVRYATNGPARSLFASADVDSIHALYPADSRLGRLGVDDRLIASEPFSDLPGIWQEIPAGTAVIVRRGGVLEHRPFRPVPAPVAVAVDA